jgi:hypothetical protein
MDGNRRTVLGLALASACGPVLAAVPMMSERRSLATLERELAAIVGDPACALASLSVLAIRDGKLAYAGQFGRRRIGNGASPDLPANRDTLYRIASVSKMITTLGLLRLVEENQVDLDADVARHLGFSVRNPHFPEHAITCATCSPTLPRCATPPLIPSRPVLRSGTSSRPARACSVTARCGRQTPAPATILRIATSAGA